MGRKRRKTLPSGTDALPADGARSGVRLESDVARISAQMETQKEIIIEDLRRRVEIEENLKGGQIGSIGNGDGIMHGLQIGTHGTILKWTHSGTGNA
jgi:hypothetical protein